MRPKSKLKGAAALEKSQKKKEAKVKRPSRVTTTNRKSRASTSKPTTRARKVKSNLTEDEVDRM